MHKTLAALALLALPVTAHAACVEPRLETDPAVAAESIREADFYGIVERLADRDSLFGTHQVFKVVQADPSLDAPRFIVLKPYVFPDGSALAGSVTNTLPVDVGERTFAVLGKVSNGFYGTSECWNFAIGTVTRAGGLDALLGRGG